MDKETIDLLKRAMHEIQSYQRRCDILQAKVDTMDTLSTFLFAQAPSRGIGMSEDIAWAIDKHLRKNDVKD